MQLRRVLAGLAACSAAATTLTSTMLPASYADSESVTVRDARGDVAEKRGLSHQERISIDLHRVRISPAARRTTIEITFREVLTRPDFDQMFFVVLSPPNGTGETWQSNVGTTTKGRGYAYYTPDDSFDELENCRVATTVERARHRLVMQVPARCLPSTEARIQIVAATGIFESDAPTSSRDSLKFEGQQLISGR